MDPYGIRLHQLGFPWQPMGISLNLSYLLRWGRGFCESLFHLPKSKVRQATQLTAKLFVQFFCADIFYIYDISILLTIDTIKWCKYIKNDLLLQADLISLKSNSQQTTIKEPTPKLTFSKIFPNLLLHFQRIELLPEPSLVSQLHDIKFETTQRY